MLLYDATAMNTLYQIKTSFHDDLPINHIAAAGKNIVVRINAVVLQLLI